MLGEYLWDLAIETSNGMVTFNAIGWDDLQRHLTDAIRAHGAELCTVISPCKPYTVGAYGKHGMVERVAYFTGACHGRVRTLRLDMSRPLAVGESKERAANCTCGLGAGAAHKLDCPAFVCTIGGASILFSGN